MKLIENIKLSYKEENNWTDYINNKVKRYEAHVEAEEAKAREKMKQELGKLEIADKNKQTKEIKSNQNDKVQAQETKVSESSNSKFNETINAEISDI